MSAPAYDLVVRGHLILPDREVPDGWVAVAGETIAAIGVGTSPPATTTHDAGGAYVIPGFVDGQTHATSYGGLPGIENTTMSAVAGGVTTLVDMPYDNPEPLNTLEKLQRKVEAIERYSHADIALYGTVIPGQGTQEMAGLAKAGVAAFKISSFESNPVRFPRLSADQTLAILEASVETGLPVGLHNEDQEIVLATVAAFKALGRTTPEWHSPEPARRGRDGRHGAVPGVGRGDGGHAHIVHFSHPRGYDIVSRYAQEGVRATAELCVHYLHFDADRDMGRLGARMKVNPPIRGGVLDGLWTRCTPGASPSSRRTTPAGPSTTSSPPRSSTPARACRAGDDGAVALHGSRRTGSFTHPHAGRLPQRAAGRFFGLQGRKGSLAVGCDADIVVLETGDYLFDAAGNHDGLCWSPYDGERFKARVAATYVRGQRAWDGATVCGTAGQGRYIPRPRTLGQTDARPRRPSTRTPGTAPRMGADAQAASGDSSHGAPTGPCAARHGGHRELDGLSRASDVSHFRSGAGRDGPPVRERTGALVRAG